MSDEISIAGLDKARVLVALYNASREQGMGFMQMKPGGLSVAEAEELLTNCTYFDYLYGRVMKVDLSGDSFNPRLYDRDNGPGAAERAVNQVRA